MNFLYFIQNLPKESCSVSSCGVSTCSTSFLNSFGNTNILTTINNKTVNKI